MYTDDDILIYQMDWGDGYMSPGGDDEVRLMFSYAGVDPKGAQVVDLGSGLGGPAVCIAKMGADKVIAIDEDDRLHEIAEDLAGKRGVKDGTIKFVRRDLNGVPWPIEEGSIDIVFSKDSIVDVENKEAVFKEAYRVLKPGGWLVGSDWLKGERPDPVADWNTFVGKWTHGEGLLTAKEVTSCVRKAGFCPVCIESRRDVVTKIARLDWERVLTDKKCRDELKERMGAEKLEDRIGRKERLYKALACGGVEPSHIRGRRP